MSRLLRGLCSVASVVLAACVPSLQPIYTSSDVVFEPALLGTWSVADGEEQALITKGDGSSYVVAYTDEKGKTERFLGHLLRVQGKLVLDLVPDVAPLAVSDSYKWMLLPMHVFFVLDAIGPEVSIAALQPDSVMQYLQTHSAAVAHMVLDDGILLTAPPAELQAFLASYGARAGVMTTHQAWVRRST